MSEPGRAPSGHRMLRTRQSDADDSVMIRSEPPSCAQMPPRTATLKMTDSDENTDCHNQSDPRLGPGSDPAEGPTEDSAA
eukprot:765543-Hanusia_phi.AAC.5